MAVDAFTVHKFGFLIEFRAQDLVQRNLGGTKQTSVTTIVPEQPLHRMGWFA